MPAMKAPPWLLKVRKAANNKRHVRKQRDLRLCVLCGDPHRGDHEACPACRVVRAAKQKARYHGELSRKARLTNAVFGASLT